jgi:hypothetical protein
MFLNVPLQQLCALPPGPLFAVKLDFQHRHFAPLVQYRIGMCLDEQTAESNDQDFKDRH